MLEKPDLQVGSILACAHAEYGLRIAQVTFLPLGYDVNTAVYRLEALDGTQYFLKLRKGVFDETTVTVPQFLKTQGLQQIIPPLETRARQLWGSLGEYKTILYPFIQGKNGYEAVLSDQQWQDFGAAMQAIHTVQVPPTLSRLIPRETYSQCWRKMVKTFQSQVEADSFDEPVAAKLAAFMKARRGTISQVVERADKLADRLKARSLEFVLCHADLHPGNLHIAADGAVYIVDWDNPLFAPKEHDLNLIGGGGNGPWRSTREEALFYAGYHSAEVDRMALAYYRFERIVLDMAEFCKQLLQSTEGGEDREQSLAYFTGSFEPGGDIEIAFKNDR